MSIFHHRPGDLKVEDIYACLDYAAYLAEEQITPIEMLENAV